jgi:hypothetical protein
VVGSVLRHAAKQTRAGNVMSNIDIGRRSI